MKEKRISVLENYNQEESFLYNETYLFIKGYAMGRNLTNTLKALPLARKIHNSQYRKGTVNINGKEYRLPYVLHVLKVCNTLISLNLPFDKEELDILLTCALLHDAIEDDEGFFRNGGKELTTDYGFPEEVYNIIKLLSKRHGATEEELFEYFNNIKYNKLALLIKLSDRSHNVEDLYNMKPEKLHLYVKETRNYIYDLANFGKYNYPELSNGITILKSKIVSLTELTETLVDIYEDKLTEKDKEIKKLKKMVKKFNKFLIKIKNLLKINV